jgi:hypothetical protein
MGNSTGAADEKAPNVGSSSAAIRESPPNIDGPAEVDGPLNVEAAMARMSMSPEPSVFCVVLGRVAAGAASDCKFDNENSTEFSLRCAVKLSTRPPS